MKGFAKVYLQPGETKTAQVRLSRALSPFLIHERKHGLRGRRIQDSRRTSCRRNNHVIGIDAVSRVAQQSIKSGGVWFPPPCQEYARFHFFFGRTGTDALPCVSREWPAQALWVAISFPTAFCQIWTKGFRWLGLCLRLFPWGNHLYFAGDAIEFQFAFSNRYLDRAAVLQLAEQQFLGQRFFDVLLYHPASGRAPIRSS